MLVITEYSTYEVDVEQRVCRRLSSVHEATPNQGKDAVWQEYHRMDPAIPEVGVAMFIDWDDAGRQTMTSLVERIER